MHYDFASMIGVFQKSLCWFLQIDLSDMSHICGSQLDRWIYSIINVKEESDIDMHRKEMIVISAGRISNTKPTHL